jgi:beta-glucanase (GH16 family)
MANPLRRLLAVPVALLTLLAVCTIAVPSAGAATKNNCGGTLIPKAGGGYWQCTWDDEFSGSTLDTTKWVVQTGPTGGPACFVNSPRNVYLGSGSLHLVTRKETKAFYCGNAVGGMTTRYSAGEVFSGGKFSQLYGRFEFRAAFPATKVSGLQEALWLWPNNDLKYGPWPMSGEIDVAELASKYPGRAVPYIHYLSGLDMNVTNNYCMISHVNYMHRYTLEWTPSTMTISYDGNVCISDVYNPGYPATSSKPFDQPFFLAMTQALGIDPNTFLPGKTPLPGVTRIDYVRVWQ